MWLAGIQRTGGGITDGGNIQGEFLGDGRVADAENFRTALVLDLESGVFNPILCISDQNRGGRLMFQCVNLAKKLVVFEFALIHHEIVVFQLLRIRR